MDSETERTVRGLNKERNVLVLGFCRGSLQYKRGAGEILAREMVLNGPPEGRWPFLRYSKIAYLGWPLRTTLERKKLQDSVETLLQRPTLG